MPQLRGKEFVAACEKLIASLESLPALLPGITDSCQAIERAKSIAKLPVDVAVRSKDFTGHIVAAVRPAK